MLMSLGGPGWLNVITGWNSKCVHERALEGECMCECVSKLKQMKNWFFSFNVLLLGDITHLHNLDNNTDINLAVLSQKFV